MYWVSGGKWVSMGTNFVRTLKQQTLTVYFAARDPDMPLGVKLLALAVAAYALSPIDLIPDFIPLLGYLDDFLVVALGTALVIRLTPPEVLARARLKAAQAVDKPVSYSAAFFILLVWLIALGCILGWFLRMRGN